MIRKGMYLQGRYGLNERLAVGGMGEVWSANDDLMGRTVAIKILRPSLSSEHTFQARFREEARTAGSLSHAGIAAVFDYGETDNLYYLVMEMVDGEPLSVHISRSAPMPVDLVLSLMSQTARALHAAHTAGVIHRDVKPANLMITPALSVKITDFGIARPQDHEPLTATGQVMGTAHYLAPELARGPVATARSQLYALGIVMYECLAGRRPFEGTNQVAVATAQLTDQPPPLPESLPSNVRKLVEQVLSKDPNQRPSTANDFADLVDRLAEGKSYVHRNTPGDGTVIQQPVSPSQGATAMMYDPIPPAGQSATAASSGTSNYASAASVSAPSAASRPPAAPAAAEPPHAQAAAAPMAAPSHPPAPDYYASEPIQRSDPWAGYSPGAVQGTSTAAYPGYPLQAGYPDTGQKGYPDNYSITPGMYPVTPNTAGYPPAHPYPPAMPDPLDIGGYPEEEHANSTKSILFTVIAACLVMVVVLLFVRDRDNTSGVFSTSSDMNSSTGGVDLDSENAPPPAVTDNPVPPSPDPGNEGGTPGDVPDDENLPEPPADPEPPVADPGGGGDEPGITDPDDGGGAIPEMGTTVDVVSADYEGKGRKWTQNQLEGLGLVVEIQQVATPNAELEGKVLKVSPEGTLEVGDTVVVTVGKRTGGE